MDEIHFESVLREEFQNLIAMKRALGNKYDTEEGAFRRIDAFLLANGLQKKEIT